MKYICSGCGYHEDREFCLVDVMCPNCSVRNLKPDVNETSDTELLIQVFTAIDHLQVDALKELEKRVQILINVRIFGDVK